VPLIETYALTKQYPGVTALNALDINVEPGIIGLVGANGAGKSTLLKAPLGLVTPTAGRLQVLGLDVASTPIRIRARLGYMPESDGHIPGMHAVSFVAYCGQLAGLPRGDAMQRAHEVLYYVGLGEARYRNLETYSTGMKQRIKLAQALVHDPDLLFLDEPTNGMDPKGRDEMLALVKDLATRKGVNLILSSHLLPDVEATCAQVIVMYQGAVAAQGAIADLKAGRREVFEIRVKGDADAFIRGLEADGLECRGSAEEVMRVFVKPGQGPRDLFEAAMRHQVQVRHLRPSVPTLEDVFAEAVGEE